MQLFIFNYPVKLMPSTCTRLPPFSKLDFLSSLSSASPHVLCLRHESAICEKFVFSPPFVAGDKFNGRRRLGSKILVISIARGCTWGYSTGMCRVLGARGLALEADKAANAFCCLLFGVRDLFCQLERGESA